MNKNVLMQYLLKSKWINDQTNNCVTVTHFILSDFLSVNYVRLTLQ